MKFPPRPRRMVGWGDAVWGAAGINGGILNMRKQRKQRFCVGIFFVSRGNVYGWQIGSWSGGFGSNVACSYGVSFRLFKASLQRHDPAGYPFITTNDFTVESQVQQPVATPVLADCIGPWSEPLATDLPPKNLVYGTGGGQMGAFAIPRHGNRPSPVPTNWPQNQPLPGAVNVAFFDGHGETVKLDNLWQLYWNVGYTPPAKRPGL
jgi:prepilin-type processing-associated H-X9-DG protein